MPSILRVFVGVLLLCSAAGVHAQLSVSPPFTDFGDQQVGATSAPQIVTLRNTGGQLLIVSAMSVVNPVFTRSGGSCGAAPFVILPQASCTLDYTFRPPTAVSYSDTVALTVSGFNPTPVHLSGRGVQGQLQVSPFGSINFPSTAVGTTSVSQTVELISVGSGSVEVLSITSATVPFARVGGTCGQTPFVLQAQDRCSLTYTFSPVAIGEAQQQTLIVEVPIHVGSPWSVDLRGDATQGIQTITFPAQSPRIYGPGYGFPVNPPAMATSGLAITYGSTTPGVCTTAASNVAVVAAGTCTLTANQPGNASWGAAPQQTQSFAIARAAQTLTFPVQGSRTFVQGGTFAISPLATSATPNAGQPIVYSSLDTSVCTVSGTTVTMLASGTCTLAANQAGNANYNAATQVIARVPLALFAHGFEVLSQ